MHELRQFRLFTRHGIAAGDKNRCGKGNLHSRDIQDHVKAQLLSDKIVGRAGGQRVDGSRFESRDSLADIPHLNVLQVPQGIHLKPGERGLGEHVGIRSNAINTQPLAFEILHGSDFLFAHDGRYNGVLGFTDNR